MSWTKKIILSAPVAIILIIWGIPGMIEDMITWQGWIGVIWDWLIKTPTILSWGLFIIGLTILLKPQRLLKINRNDKQLSVEQPKRLAQEEQKGALDHVLLRGRSRDSLQIQKAYNPWRIIYPIFIRNTRPVPINMVGCTTTILWDDSPIQSVSWKIPESEWSNGFPFRPSNVPVDELVIPPDTPYTLHVPFNILQAPNPPTNSPKWSLRGTVYFQCDGEQRNIQFNFGTDYYEISQGEWQEWLSQVPAKTIGANPIIQVIDKYEEYLASGHECGLVFQNLSDNNLNDCQAKLLDLEYETPHGSLSYRRLLRLKKLVCDEQVPGFSKGKLPLVRWGKATASKNAEFVYDGGVESVAYGVANTPILLLLNIWAGNTPATYAICKLSDRMWGGYELYILKTGLQKENPKLEDFQILDSDKEGSQTE